MHRTFAALILSLGSALLISACSSPPSSLLAPSIDRIVVIYGPGGDLGAEDVQIAEVTDPGTIADEV